MRFTIRDVPMADGSAALAVSLWIEHRRLQRQILPCKRLKPKRAQAELLAKELHGEAILQPTTRSV